MTTTVFDVLKKEIEEQKVSCTELLTSGGARDFAQYKDAAGFIRGLDTCLRSIEDLSRKFMDDDDE